MISEDLMYSKVEAKIGPPVSHVLVIYFIKILQLCFFSGYVIISQVHFVELR